MRTGNLPVSPGPYTVSVGGGGAPVGTGGSYASGAGGSGIVIVAYES
jgi:hypothetical protein